MTLKTGTRLGAYEITGVLGSGGMGEVYRARDLRLRRDVAIKVLPQSVAGDPDRLARLEREAQLLAALNHPHIAQIFGLEESDGVRALVMELVEGEDLAARIARAPIAVGEAVSFARQIAEALESAHARGIVHRDLKPANIRVAGATVKVLDFGIAKAIETGPPVNASDTPTLTNPLASRHLVVGTPAYMSPEQAAGAGVDRRTDIWAFGCVLYEMLTRTRAFAGHDASDTRASINVREPDLTRLPEPTPYAVRRLLRRCLQKDPSQRLHDMADARLELQDAAAGSTDDAPIAQPAAAIRRAGLAWAAAGVLLIAFVSAIAWNVRSSARPGPAPRTYRTAIVLPSEAPAGGGPAGRFALSADGGRLAYAASGSDGERRLWIRSLDDVVAVPVPGSEDGSAPFWSPDGRFLAFFAHNKLKKIDVAGGPPLTLCDARGAIGGSWSDAGVIVFARSRAGLHAVSDAGGTPRSVSTVDPARGEVHHVWPSALPGGRHVLYHAAGSKTGGPFDANGIYAAAIGSADRTLLVEGGSNAQYADGYLLFIRRQALMAQRFDAERLALSGDPIMLAEGLAMNEQFTAGAFSSSASGVLAYQQAAPQPPSRLLWFDRSGKPLGALGDAAYYRHPELSPDGKQVAVAILDPTTATRDLWLVDVARGVPTRLTSSDAEERFPVWSPDGRRIAFTAGREGAFDVIAKEPHATAAETALVQDRLNKYPTSWSHDGKYLLYYTGGTTPATGNDLFALPLFGDRKPLPYLQTPFSETEGRFSPNGRWVAYESRESGETEVYVASFPTPAIKRRVSANGGRVPRWHHEGRELFFLTRTNTLTAVSIKAVPSGLNVGPPRPLFETRPAHSSWALSADSRRFLVNTAPDDSTTVPLTLFINWTAAIRDGKSR